MNTVGMIGGAVLCAALSLVLREYKGLLAALPVLLGGVLLLSGAFAFLSPLTEFFAFFSGAGLASEVVLVGKVLGVGYLTEIGADLCRDLGAPTLAARLEFLGRMEILLLCLPVLKELLGKALEMLS